MTASFRLARLFGIDVNAHASWVVIVLLVTLSLAAQFGASHPAWPAPQRFAAALVGALLFFASVVVHELAHSLLARRHGIPVRSITLFLFGGVSQLESEAKRPSVEFTVAAVGPLTSVALALLFAAAALVAGGEATFTGALAGWLASINLMLALFNLLPAFPLDGGRVLRGLVWWKTGDVRRATRVAAGAGQALALLLVLFGVWSFFAARQVGGLWLAFLGWFLHDAARASARQLELQTALRGVTAADLMTSECAEVPPGLPLDRLVEEVLFRTGQRCFLVVGDGRVQGLLTVRDLRAVDRARWPETTAGEAMRPVEGLAWVRPGDRADRVLELLGREGLNQLPVMDDGRLLGIVTRESLLRLLATRMELEA